MNAEKGSYLDQGLLQKLGVVLVPIKPTEWMEDSAFYQCPSDTKQRHVLNFWAAMIVKAPRLDIDVPNGTILMPLHPTDEMLKAGIYEASHDASLVHIHSAYVDMIAVATNCPGYWMPDDDNKFLTAMPDTF